MYLRLSQDNNKRLFVIAQCLGFLPKQFQSDHPSTIFFSQLLKKLNSSRPAIKPNGNVAAFNNHRNFARAVGMLQHDVELFRIRFNVEIFNILFLFGISFTSCPCVRSGIFAENQYFFSHGSFLRI
jgi:hypothetical protein